VEIILVDLIAFSPLLLQLVVVLAQEIRLEAADLVAGGMTSLDKVLAEPELLVKVLQAGMTLAAAALAVVVRQPLVPTLPVLMVALVVLALHHLLREPQPLGAAAAAAAAIVLAVLAVLAVVALDRLEQVMLEL
jgi:hypothetical protein